MVQRIVVLRYRFVGDTLITLPFLRALRKKYPDAWIDWMVGKDCIALMERCPDINRALVFEPREMGFWACVKQLKQGHYDTAYLLKRSFSSALMTFLSGIPHRIGFDTEHRGWLLTQKIPYNADSGHEAQHFLKILNVEAPVGSPALKTDILSWIPPECFSAVEPFWAQAPTEAPRILLHVAAGHPGRYWPMASFQQLAQVLVETHQTHLFILGVPGECDYIQQFYTGLPATLQPFIHNLCGKTSLLESLALISKMHLAVSNDTGMIHLADAVGVPTVSIFGPSAWQQWHPLSSHHGVVKHPVGLNCQPCRLKRITCGHTYPCLTEIPVDTVQQVCDRWLAEQAIKGLALNN